MAPEITVKFSIGDKALLVSASPSAIARMIDHRTGGQLKGLFQKVVDDRLGLTDVTAILGVFERDAEILKYLDKLIAAGGEAEATAREGAAVLITAGAAAGNAAGR